MTQTPSPLPVDPTLSVNEVLLRWPIAVAVLNAFGVDTCCGGALSLRDAATAAGVPVEDVVAAIRLGHTATRVQARSGA